MVIRARSTHATPRSASTSRQRTGRAATTESPGTFNDVCTTGVCTSGAPDDQSCDDGNVCTDDVCDVALGCTNPNNTDPCDDGVSRTSGDVCGAGVCAGISTCPGGDVCNLVLNICEGFALRINLNGPEHVGTDWPGIWAADPGVGGACGPSAFTTASAINGTLDDALFQGEVFGNPTTCSVGGGTIPSGTYDVNLLFAEIFFGPGCAGGGPGTGARVFDIELEGAPMEAGFDIFAEGGCAASTTDPTTVPVVRSYQIAILDGSLDVLLPATVNNGMLSAIEVLPVPEPAWTVLFGSGLALLLGIGRGRMRQ